MGSVEINFTLLLFSSKDKATTQKKHKTCPNHKVYFFKTKWSFIFTTHIFFHFLSILSDLKIYKCTKLNFSLPFWASEAKAQYKRAMKKMNVLNFKISFGIVNKINIDPNFDNHIFIIFLGILNYLNGHECTKLNSKKTFWTWEAKAQCLKIWNFMKT